MRVTGVLVLAATLSGCGGDLNHRAELDSAAGEVERSIQGSFVIGLAEWKVDSPVDTLPAGRYTFRVENAGSMAHALEIEGNGKEWETGDLRAGAASELTVDLEPGTYELYCPVESRGAEHDERGMRRRLVVRPA
jgi:uncharacterized cupredoxin-like copper-binding protein